MWVFSFISFVLSFVPLAWPSLCFIVGMDVEVENYNPLIRDTWMWLKKLVYSTWWVLQTWEAWCGLWLVKMACLSRFVCSAHDGTPRVSTSYCADLTWLGRACTRVCTRGGSVRTGRWQVRVKSLASKVFLCRHHSVNFRWYILTMNLSISQVNIQLILSPSY